MDRSPTPPPVRWSLALRAAAPAPPTGGPTTPTPPATPDRAWLGTRPAGPRPEARPLGLSTALAPTLAPTLALAAAPRR
jgi:hypothetical protein